MQASSGSEEVAYAVDTAAQSHRLICAEIEVSILVQNLGALSPPPPLYAPPMMFTVQPRQAWLTLPGSGLPEALRSGPPHARVGRGGRLLIDRVHPVTYVPLNGSAHPENRVSCFGPSLYPKSARLWTQAGVWPTVSGA